MQSFRILNRCFRTLRRIGTVDLSVHRWRTVHPRVQILHYSASSTSTKVRSSQAVISETLKQLESKFGNIEDSDPDITKKRSLQAAFVCEQFNKLQNLNSEDKTSDNGVHQEVRPEQVRDLFKSMKSDPSQLFSENVAECVAAYVKLSLAVCSEEAERNACLNLEEYCKFEKHLKNNLSQQSLGHLVQLYNTFFECRLIHPQTVMFLACEKLLKERVPEVTEVDESVALCRVVYDSDQQLWESIEKCTDLFIDKMSLLQVMTCLHSLVSRASPTEVNNRLHHKLCSKILEHDVPPLQVHHLSVIASVMKKFSDADEVILKKVCDRIMQIKPNKDQAKFRRDTQKLCSLLNSLDKLQWAQKDVFDMISTRVLQCKIERPPKVDVSTQILINAANLNIRLSDGKGLINRLVTARRKTKKGELHKQAQLLWAICVMGEQDKAAKQIDFLFKTALSSSGEVVIPANSLLMFMRNLRDIAMTTSIPLTSLPFLPKLQEVEQQRKSGLFENAVCDCIEKCLPEGSYRRNVISPAGYKIDLEVYVNGNGDAMARNDQTTDLHRVAVKTRGYFTFSRPDNLPLGWVVMENRNLVKEGYTVVEIPYHEWQGEDGEATKTINILNKMKKSFYTKTHPNATT